MELGSDLGRVELGAVESCSFLSILYDNYTYWHKRGVSTRELSAYRFCFRLSVARARPVIGIARLKSRVRRPARVLNETETCVRGVLARSIANAPFGDAYD